MEEYIGIFLNLHKYELLGWEDGRSLLLVKCMREGIRLGHKFPAVNIIPKKNHTYQILTDFSVGGDLGGHHRAIAHYKERFSLRCNLFNKTESFCYSKIPIRKITLQPWISLNLKNSLIHLPEEIAKRFCDENNLNFKKYYLDSRRGKIGD